MSSSPPVIATITWARTPREGETLSEALTLLTRHGLPVVVADRGSDRSFSHFLTTLPGVVVARDSRPPRSLVEQVRRSLSEAVALGADRVLYTEPDKAFFFEHRLSHFLRAAQDDGRDALFLASRDETSFDTFPPFQQYTEAVINRVWTEVVGHAGDSVYGPMLLPARVVRTLDRVNEGIGWGWRPFLTVVAQRLGIPVVPIPLDLPCPPDQQSEDDRAARLYRARQLAENIQGMLAGTTILLE